MATSSSTRSLVRGMKRLGLSQEPIVRHTRSLHHSTLLYKPEETTTATQEDGSTSLDALLSDPKRPINPSIAQREMQQIRLPRAVQVTYLTPLRRRAVHETPVCDLQLRSYSVRNLEAFADFALRAAYYLNLPAKGPVPLPRITERWTVPRSNFIFKKSQENFERITLRRLIQIQDGHQETVAVWLGFLQKFSYYGVGMKANVFEQSGLDVAQDLDGEGQRIENMLALGGQQLKGIGENKGPGSLKKRSAGFERVMFEEPFKAAFGASAPMTASQGALGANRGVQGWTLHGQENLMGRPRDDEATGVNKKRRSEEFFGKINQFKTTARQERSKSREAEMEEVQRIRETLPDQYYLTLSHLSHKERRAKLEEEGRCSRCGQLEHGKLDESCPLYQVGGAPKPSRIQAKKARMEEVQRIRATLPDQYYSTLRDLSHTERRARLEEEGRCLRCGQLGHGKFAENCPLHKVGV